MLGRVGSNLEILNLSVRPYPRTIFLIIRLICGSAILKYGLSHFAFVILEYCHSSDLLKREQHYLDLLFSLAKELRYNFSSVAEAFDVEPSTKVRRQKRFKGLD